MWLVKVDDFLDPPVYHAVGVVVVVRVLCVLWVNTALFCGTGFYRVTSLPC